MKTILEGVTGTGKSHTIAALRRLGLAPPVVVDEEETFGDVMSELAEGTKADGVFVRRLVSVLGRLNAEKHPSFLLERFHLSYYALAPEWTRYDDIDRRLADLGVSLVLLVVDDDSLRARSLCRAEYGGQDWQDFARLYGSEAKALTALRDSQHRRLEALAKTRLRHLTINTGDRMWDDYAKTLSSFA
jgi:hypothetical protein